MKIAVNTRLLLSGKMDGIGWFTYETLRRITTQHPEHEFVFIFDRKYSEEFIFSDNVKPVIAHPQSRHPVLWYLYFEYGIPSVLKKVRPDLFFSPDGWLSLRTDIRSMAVIHDLNFEEHPEFIPGLVRNYYHYFFPRFARKASRIATVSEYTRQDISKRYGVDKGKIDVVYNGANEEYIPLSEEEIKSTREKYTGGEPYFITVGTIHPRKNLTNLLKAFGKFKSDTDNNVKLLVVGDKKWWTDDIRMAYEGLQCKEDIIFGGRLSTEELHKCIASSLAMTYVSFFEGFGIPIVEAFYCGVPVITSNRSSMPEVAGDAAILVDPFSIDSICDALIKLFSDSRKRNELIEKGNIRKNEFSWQKSADKLWASMEKVLP